MTVHRQLDDDLVHIRQSLLDMAGRVEEMIADALRALVERDAILAGRVIRRDRAVDRLEKEIDEACLVSLALHEPKAVDFRFLVAVQKIVGDLERMGDCAVNMAQAVLELCDEPPLAPYVDLPRLSEMARTMVRQSLDAFVGKDPELARRVLAGDDQVDALYEQLFDELVEAMIEDREQVTRALQLLLVAKNLERVGDHATNVAEDVIYYLEATDIRHSAPEEDRRSRESG